MSVEFYFGHSKIQIFSFLHVSCLRLWYGMRKISSSSHTPLPPPSLSPPPTCTHSQGLVDHLSWAGRVNGCLPMHTSTPFYLSPDRSQALGFRLACRGFWSKGGLQRQILASVVLSLRFITSTSFLIKGEFIRIIL